MRPRPGFGSGALFSQGKLVAVPVFPLDHSVAAAYNGVRFTVGVASSLLRSVSVFPFLHPRVPDLVLGLAIGLSLSLVWHWVVWTLR